MAWVVDTCVLIDVAIDDPEFGDCSARFLQARMRSGLVICPITFVEIGSVFSGDLAAQRHFLDDAGVDCHEPWTPADTETANRLWSRFVLRKREAGSTRRPVAEILIGAFAMRFDGLSTRYAQDYRRLCPGLTTENPRF